MKLYCIDREDFKDNYVMCNAFVATAIIGAGALAAGATIYASSQASKAQTNAANTAAQTAQGFYNTTRGDLSDYQAAGQDATKKLQDANYYTDPIVMDQNALEATPGYQFTKTQGLKATQNAVAARGLGVSGAALKGAATFATGLADNTYKTQFDIANINQTNAYNRLKGIIDTGESAAAKVGSAGTQLAPTITGAQIGAGNAQAAAYNMQGGAINSFANNVGGYAAYKGLYGNSPDSSSGSQAPPFLPDGSRNDAAYPV